MLAVEYKFFQEILRTYLFVQYTEKTVADWKTEFLCFRNLMNIFTGNCSLRKIANFFYVCYKVIKILKLIKNLIFNYILTESSLRPNFDLHVTSRSPTPLIEVKV